MRSVRCRLLTGEGGIGICHDRRLFRMVMDITMRGSFAEECMMMFSDGTVGGHAAAVFLVAHAGSTVLS